MAYLTITSTENLIKVDFGVYSGANVPTGTIPRVKGYQKNYVEFSLPEEGTDYVNAVSYAEKQNFSVSFDGSENTFKVDTVDGVAPTNNIDLFNKLLTLLG